MSSGVINIGQPDQFKGIVVKSKEPGEKRLNEQERKSSDVCSSDLTVF